MIKSQLIPFLMLPIKLKLDAAEESVRSVLLGAARDFSARNGKAVCLRFTGGWVRDKILQKTSHDIDVAIDTATGEEFASSVHEYLKNTGALPSSSVHTIARNPDKSKHLETATMKIGPLDVDFVNLRSEDYIGDSRVPVMKFGTPQEDALRRDATLNALFYNLADDKVEDFTGKGIEDLRHGILRTPLDPSVTFRDDPLRILRLLRFVAQYDFTLASDAAAAISDPMIGCQIARKVSRERVGTELAKLVAAPYALKGLSEMVNLDVLRYVFSMPPGYTCNSKPDTEWVNLAEIEHAASVLSHLSFKIEDLGSIWLAVCLKNWNGHLFQNSKKKLESAAGVFIREGVKLPRARGVLVDQLLASVEPVHNLASQNHSRRMYGQFVRDNGETWPMCLAFTACVHQDQESLQKIENLYTTINDLGVETAYDLKPLLDGNQIRQIFAGRKGGPWLREASVAVMNFQLDNPQAKPEEIAEHLKKNII